MDLPIIESTHDISAEDEEEIKETICTLIDDYMKDNILDYKYADLRKKTSGRNYAHPPHAI